MRSSEPTLRVDFATKANPACSLCGMPFGSEGMARSLMDAFALHVRRQHLAANGNSTIGTTFAKRPLIRGSQTVANQLRRMSRGKSPRRAWRKALQNKRT